MTKLKLEVGKYYRTRDGRKVKLYYSDTRSHEFPYRHDCGVEDGYTAVDVFGASCLVECDLDIITEWTDTPALKVGDKVKVVARETYHNFEIGDIVTLKRLETDSGHLFVNSRGLENWMTDDEYKPIPTIGTLAEIGAQVGDVVKAVGYPDTLTIEYIRQGSMIPYYMRKSSGEVDWYSGKLDKWRIVSRASDAKSPVELSVDLDEAIRQVVAESQSGPVQLRKVIVPGVYGKVEVMSSAGRGVDLRFPENDLVWSRDDLTEAIAALTAIRDAM